MPLNVTAMEGWGYTVYTKKCPNDTCVSLWITLSLNIHIQILQTDLYISFKNELRELIFF